MSGWSLRKMAGVETDDELVVRVNRGDPQAFNALLVRHNDLLTRKSDAFRRAPVPPSAIYAHAVKLTRQAAQRYTPGTGAQFRTYLESNLRLTRFVNGAKNVARVPEHRSLMVGRYKTAKTLLTDEKDRDPTATEMAEHLGWSVADVERMETVLSRRELSSSGMQYDQLGGFSARFEDGVEMLYYSLTPEEQLVLDYSLGRHGKPQTKSVAEMSRATGLTADRIYAIKRTLARKLSSLR